MRRRRHGRTLPVPSSARRKTLHFDPSCIRFDGGALSYGFAALWGRRHLADVAPLKSATCQLLASTLIIAMVVAVVDRPWTLAVPSAGIWLALGALALFGTAIVM